MNDFLYHKGLFMFQIKAIIKAINGGAINVNININETSRV